VSFLVRRQRPKAWSLALPCCRRCTAPCTAHSGRARFGRTGRTARLAGPDSDLPDDGDRDERRWPTIASRTAFRIRPPSSMTSWRPGRACSAKPSASCHTLGASGVPSWTGSYASWNCGHATLDLPRLAPGCHVELADPVPPRRPRLDGHECQVEGEEAEVSLDRSTARTMSSRCRSGRTHYASPVIGQWVPDEP
jgi:hypothetical protein